MTVQKVSFGSVIAVYGNDKKLNKILRRVREDGKNHDIIRKDVTSQYVNSASSGLLSQAAQKGDRIDIYITGKEDTSKYNNKAEKWDTIDGVLSHLSKAPYNANRLSIGDILSGIFNS